MGWLIQELPSNDRLACSVGKNYNVDPHVLTRSGRHHFMGAISRKLDLNKKVTRMVSFTKLGERKHTKRYVRLLDFLQEGHSRAMVEVTLKNEGEDADKDMSYGADITFQRIIDENGRNSVAFKDHQQNVVKKAGSTKRSRTSPSIQSCHHVPLHVRLSQLISH